MKASLKSKPANISVGGGNNIAPSGSVAAK